MHEESRASGTRPFTEAHAIAWVDVGVSFNESLASDELDEIRLRLIEVLSPHGFVPAEVDEELRSDELAIALERSDDSGDVLEVVHVHESYAHVISHEYRGWQLTRDCMIKRLSTVLELIRGGTLASSRLSLCFRDIFINEDFAKYDVTEVFRPNEFLPQVVFEGRPFWYHQLALGASRNSKTPYRSLSRCTIDARISDFSDEEDEEELVHVTEITHRQVLAGISETDAGAQWTDDVIAARLDEMHGKNKQFLLGVLSEKMADRIGLREAGDE